MAELTAEQITGGGQPGGGGVRPDSDAVGERSLPAAAFPAGGIGMRVYIEPAAHKLMHAHARETIGLEVCGVMVGEWKQDAAGPYVYVSACICGTAATSKFAEVTFTHETWAAINKEMDSTYGDAFIVGWYHTHPDFGIFLSDRDVFIHEHFFSDPGQIALVIDPVRNQEGVFRWAHGKPVLTASVWVGNVQASLPASPDRKSAPAMAAPNEGGRERTAGQRADGSVGVSFLSIIAVVSALIAGLLLGSRKAEAEREMVIQGLAQQILQQTRSQATVAEIRAARTELASFASIAEKLRRSAEVPAKAEKESQNGGPVSLEFAVGAARQIELKCRDLNDRLNAAEKSLALGPEEIGALRAVLADVAFAQQEAVRAAAVKPATKAPGEPSPMSTPRATPIAPEVKSPSPLAPATHEEASVPSVPPAAQSKPSEGGM